jgi:hypothetical protein
MQKRITRFSIVLLLALSLRLILEPNAKSLALYAQSTEHSQTKPTVVLVRPAHWSKSLAEWKTYRSSEYQFSEVDSVGDSELLRKQIAKAISEGATPTAAILLCGDATLEVAPKQWRALTPGIVLDTQIQLGELTTKELCTDALYGDLDQDGCPDVAVGRLPAKTPEELTRMLRRSMDYEAIRPGPWNDTVHVTAGVGGFGYLADTAIETVTRRFLTEGIPSQFHMNVTVASCTSSYCPNPWKLRESYIDRINQGGLFWVYIGHGQVQELDRYEVDGKWLPIGQPSDAARFRCQNRPPIALMLACFTGAFDARVDCFSESLLAQPSGPIAVISGSRVTMPYGLSQLSSELLNGCFRDRIPTLGELLLQAKRRVWVDDETSSIPNDPDDRDQPEVFDIRKRYRKIVTDMAHALNPSDHDLTLERREHVRLMNLLGDPLLKIPYPQPIEVNLPSKATSGERIKISGQSAVSGRLIAEVSLVRDRVPQGVVPVRAYQGTEQENQQMDRNYQTANQLTVTSISQVIDAGRFEVELQIPSDSSGRHVVSVYVYGNREWSVGSQKLLVRKTP